MADGKVTIDTTLDSSGLKTGLSKLGTTGQKIASTALKGTVAAIGTVTAAVVGIGTASIKVGSTFESAMSQVEATMGDKSQKIVTYNGKTMTSIEALTEYARLMGETTEFSATQSAEALNYMALAGYDAETSIAMLPNVLNLASAGTMDLALASDMVTDTQTAFGISLERTTQMVDEMAKASSTGNTSVQQLGEAFLVVGGLAQELNGGFVTLADGTLKEVDGVQELEIALTAMANAGVKGSEAGTHMRNMLLKLSKPTDAGVAQLEQLGVTVFDDAGKMRSLADVFGDLNTELSKVTQEERIKAIGDLFNVRDLASAEALLNAVGQDWNAIGVEIADAEGSAEKMAKVKLDNLNGDITLFKSALEGLGITIFNEMDTPLREIVQSATEYIGQLQEGFKSGGIEGLLDAVVGIITDIINKIIELVPQILSTIGETIPKIAGMFVELIPQIVESISTGLPLMAEAGVQLLMSLIQGYADLFEKVAPTFEENGAKILSLIVEAIMSSATILLQGFTDAFTYAMTFVPTVIPAIVEAITQIMDNAVTVLLDNMPALLEASEELFNVIVEAIPTILPLLLESAPKLINAFIKAYTKEAPIVLKGALLVWKAIIQAINLLLPPLIKALPQIINTIITILQDNMPLIMDCAFELFNVLVEEIPEIIKLLEEQVPLIVSAIIDTLQPLKDKFKELFGLVIDIIIDWVTESTKEFIKGAGEFITSFFDEFPFVDEMKDKLDEVKDKIVEYKDKLSDKAQELGEKIFDGVKDKVENLPSEIKSIGNQLVTGLWNGINDKFSWLTTQIKTFAENVKNKLKGFFGIKSPSRVMRDEVGKFLAEGIGVGFIQNNPIDEIKASLKNSMKELQNQIGLDAQADITTAIQTASPILNFYDTQTTPDAIYQKFYQQQTFGLARQF